MLLLHKTEITIIIVYRMLQKAPTKDFEYFHHEEIINEKMGRCADLDIT